MKKILQKEAQLLRKIAESVPPGKITSPKIQKILQEMKTILVSQDDGVAIAAPQIGYSLRIFIISKRVQSIVKKFRPESQIDARIDKDNKVLDENTFKDMVFINPNLKKISKEKMIVEEGCLSVRYLYGKVSRGRKAVVEAYDEKGKKFTKGASGLMSQIFQHEVDHLNGILFIDKAKYVEEILPEKTNPTPIHE